MSNHTSHSGTEWHSKTFTDKSLPILVEAGFHGPYLVNKKWVIDPHGHFMTKSARVSRQWEKKIQAYTKRNMIVMFGDVEYHTAFCTWFVKMKDWTIYYHWLWIFTHKTAISGIRFLWSQPSRRIKIRTSREVWTKFVTKKQEQHDQPHITLRRVVQRSYNKNNRKGQKEKTSQTKYQDNMQGWHKCERPCCCRGYWIFERWQPIYFDYIECRWMFGDLNTCLHVICTISAMNNLPTSFQGVVHCQNNNEFIV